MMQPTLPILGVATYPLPQISATSATTVTFLIIKTILWRMWQMWRLDWPQRAMATPLRASKTRTEIAKRLRISRASVYRVLGAR